MIRKAVEPRKVGKGEGIALVAGIVAALYAVSFAGQAANRITGKPISALILWLCAGILAAWVMRRYLRGFVFTVDGGILYVERVYGSHSRIILQTPIGDILKIGEPGEGKAHLRAVCSRNDTPVKRMEYRDENGETRVMLFRADPEILAALTKDR